MYYYLAMAAGWALIALVSVQDNNYGYNIKQVCLFFSILASCGWFYGFLYSLFEEVDL